jgi:3' terminal RNA ribose 2'-O-methyltransferase Hen1
MLLTLTTTYKPAMDMGYLLHKNPYRCQATPLPFGTAHVFYTVATETICTFALLLDIDPIDLVRGKKTDSGMPFDQYVNDRPYVCSSFMSVALSRILSQTLNGRCKDRPDLVQTIMPLVCRLSVLPSRGGEAFIRRLFEPLGYSIRVQGHALDATFPEWGNSAYYTLELSKETTVVELFNHLYVLIPVLDNQKHYYIDASEIEKLLKHGEGWLESHPEKVNITRRYLKYKRSYAMEALSRLMDMGPAEPEDSDTGEAHSEDKVEQAFDLDEERLRAVANILKESGAAQVLDLGCGEGKLIRLLLKERQFTRIIGLDVSIQSLEIAAERLRLDELPSGQRERIELLQGSLMYRDRRLDGYDAAAVVEVIEHLDGYRLEAFERAVFEFARPETVVITTPNREYNQIWENLGAGGLRHRDHRFEWTRSEFCSWATDISKRYDYEIRFMTIGPVDERYGSPTQMCVFTHSQNLNG